MATSGKRASTSVKQKSSTSTSVKSLAGSALTQKSAPIRQKSGLEPKGPWGSRGKDREAKDILSQRQIKTIIGQNEQSSQKSDTGLIEAGLREYEIYKKNISRLTEKKPTFKAVDLLRMSARAPDWQSLLEEGLRHKSNTLNSAPFRSTHEIAELLGVGDAAVRRRLREHKIFSIKSPIDGDYRIPAWAVDPAISGAVTKNILTKFGALGEWTLYEFLSRPNGAMKGLRPFELLISPEHLPAGKRATLYDLWSGLEGHFPSPAEYVINVLTAQAEEDLGYVIANNVPSQPA